jgi:glycosyltransferase involved in cell wall biosynthesis
MLDFFLSEMSVSDLHGGGITLQRVLGSDLGKIARFVHPGTFARDVPPTQQEVLARSEFAVSLLEKVPIRRLIGARLGAWSFGRAAVQSWNARRPARVLRALFPGRSALRALVCPQAQSAVNALERLKTTRPIRYITWLMDDHVVRYVGGHWVYPPGFRRTFEKHLCEADSVFVISPVLAEFYEREFGVRPTILFGPADAVANPLYEAPSRDGFLRIGYFGKLWNWQLDGLVRFASVLEQRKQRLDIYTPDELPTELQLPGVTGKGFLPKEAVREHMQRYDAVLLPLSFSDAERNMVELNIATKMSECLASGTVTIVFGPTYAAMVRFLQPTGAACVITDASPKDWGAVVHKLLDVHYRRRALDAARDLVKSQLSTDVMRSRWTHALSRLTTRHSALFEKNS